MKQLSRREFLRLSTASAFAVITVNLPACVGLGSQRQFETEATFTHGVASGDPLSDRVILWTRAVSETSSDVVITLQIAKDADFESVLIEKGLLGTNADKDYTLKVDMTGLEPGTVYYYRFLSQNNISSVGRTRTLPIGNIESVKLLVASCSYYSAGFYHVYAEMAKHTDANAVLHLGDYIYEYGPGIYADEKAEDMGRVMQPAHELLKLDDYRQRYAQTRSDTDLQNLHSALPMIPVWDDHEITNDTWVNGAENHSDEEGDFLMRRMAALQSYAEWMPIRPPVEKDLTSIQRQFQFGNLVNLTMLDTRLVARDQQLAYADYMDTQTGEFIGQKFFDDLNNPDRQLLGTKQLEFLKTSFSQNAKWQVLGQQVLMGKMHMPAPIVTQQLSTADYGKLAQQAQKNPESLTQKEHAIMQAPSIPYNLDAWDGYPAERKRVLNAAKEANVNLVVLAGDTHNAWMNELVLGNEPVAVEFATASVSSPGLEKYVGASAEDEAGTVAAIPGLQYCNLVERGYLTVTFTVQDVSAEWNYVDTVFSELYSVMVDRKHKKIVPVW